MQQKEAADEEEKETHSRVPAELEATMQRHQRNLFQSSFFQSSLELNDARRTVRLQVFRFVLFLDALCLVSTCTLSLFVHTLGLVCTWLLKGGCIFS